MAAARKSEASEAGPPVRLAEGPPPQEPTTLPLIAVMEIQRTLGSLTKSVETLSENQKAMQAELGAISQKVSTAQTVVWTVGGAIMVAVAVVGWLIDKAIDVLPSLLAPK